MPENGTPGLLWLTSDPFPVSLPLLSPGDAVWWQVGAHLRDEDLGALTLQLASSGDVVTMPAGVEISIQTCATPWEAEPPTCSSTPTVVTPTMRLADIGPTDVMALGQLTPEQSVWVLFTLQLPADAGDEMQGRTGQIGVGLTASGAGSSSPTIAPTTSVPVASSPVTSGPVGSAPVDSAVPSPVTPPAPGGQAPAIATVPGPLPGTGTDVVSSLLVAIGAIAVGLAIAGIARRRAGARR